MKPILNMINISNIKQEDLTAFKELYPDYYKGLVQVILNRTENLIKSKKKILIKTQNKLSDLEKIAIDLHGTIQDLPKNQSQQITENDLREFIPENTFDTSIANPKYAMWYKNNINIICEHRGRKMGLPKDYPLVQRDCCYGLEIGAY